MDEDIVSVTFKYFQGLSVIGQCIVYRLTRTWLYLDFMFNLTKAAYVQKVAVKDLHKFTTQIIQERKEYVKTNKIENWKVDDEVYGKKSRLAMLDLLLDQEKKGMIDEEGIREEVDTFMFEVRLFDTFLYLDSRPSLSRLFDSYNLFIISYLLMTTQVGSIHRKRTRHASLIHGGLSR